ncbi:Spo0E family sporulation regulatory protein-aspartic acid phosphatase [Carboxydothermus ferrireducens]|uniref:Spo0E like sporulation regulatory protein n=1 Tax=Carboxydothermus ferrireducens DSM 11255 TaxID=1119529 RepID=A0ABX2R7R8_9THEO|nr:Spo0E family sporulation regulatory protein-aspartic acid phosphatase [Carboxydothermus ferrireducens]NYE57209.1 hypothetical protein [Carboxydothermus ferrireducens DSM 11255]
MNIGKILIKIEKTRRTLMNIDLSEREKLIKISQKLDELIVLYYKLKEKMN